MSKSLNEAFIRAYSKERKAAAERAEDSQPTSDVDPLVVRIDTATIDIPPPHILSSATRPRVAAMVAAKPAVAQQARPAKPSPVAAAAPTVNQGPTPPHSAHLPPTPGIQDGIWQEQFDALGGYAISDSQVPAGPIGSGAATNQFRAAPIADSSHGVSAAETQTTIQPPAEIFRTAATPLLEQPDSPSDAEGGQVAAELYTPVSPDVPEYTVLPEEVSQPQSHPTPADNESVVEPAFEPEHNDLPVTGSGEETPQVLPSHEMHDAQAQSDSSAAVEPVDSEPAMTPQADDVEAPHQHQAAQSPTQRYARELESPASPALHFDAVHEAVKNFAAGRRENGDIFRLDRPSYSPEDSQAAQDEQEDSTQAHSNSGQNSWQEVETRPELSDTEAVGTQRTESAADRGQAARTAEESLRNAKLKVFNPVWEVDALQWPAVCSELISRRAENLERVAKNLVSACHEGLQVLAVTSPSGGEGRTTVACCLAMLAGSRGLNVAILDGDIENPTLSAQTNLDIEQDWKTAMVNQLPLEEVAVHSIDDQVTLLPLIDPIQSHEIASDDNRIAFMLHELSQSFDLVIVDMGHMDSTRSLVTSMGEQGIINAVVTVVDLRSSSPQRLEACIRRIRRTGVSSIGLVENFAA